MNTISLYEKYDKPIVIALGFFDCIHKGHKALINEAQRIAVKFQAESAFITFATDPNPRLNKTNQIYSLNQRKIVAKNLGVENLVYANFDEKFAQTEGVDFLNLLTNNFNIKAVVVGRDYKFGKNASCNVEFLKNFLASLDIKTKIVPFEKNYQRKISTTNLKKLVIEGNISLLNASLTQPYFQIGNIVHAKNRGTYLGFPTANMSINTDCLKLASGIYATKIYVDGKVHYGMTNVGEKPTFEDNDYSIETYIFNFNKDIYGKEVKLEYYKKIRNVIKFKSIPELVNQMQSDEQNIKEYFEIK